MGNKFCNGCFIFSGKPVDVEVSVSLRNILEIDEHKQVGLHYIIYYDFLINDTTYVYPIGCIVSFEAKTVLVI